jgi:predicted transcriptional regulator
MTEENPHFTTFLASQIVRSYVEKNQVAENHLPALIKSVIGALQTDPEPAVPIQERPKPAVPINKSVHDDYIVCLEDGAQLKMLKRYLATRYNMTPEQYRTRWGLSADYPMTCPSHASKRSSLAKSAGLGRKVDGRTGRAEATAPWQTEAF